MKPWNVLTIFAAVTASARPLGGAPQPAAGDFVVVRAKPSLDVFHWLRSASADIWAHTPSSVDFRVPRSKASEFAAAFPAAGGRIVEQNVQQLLGSERQAVAALRREFRQALEAEDPSGADELYFDNYHPYDEMVGWSGRLAKRYPSVVTLEQFGTTLENRTYTMVHVTGAGGDPATKKRVWIQGLQHAREWIAGSAVQYVTEQLAKGYVEKNERIVKLLDQVEFLLTPIANPDGYAYTWTEGNRLWRKNMRRFENGTLYGVDLNRNWPDHWCVGPFSSPDNPNDDTFCGEKPLSEPEVLSLSTRYSATPNVIGALDFHSYTQLLLRPYGWTDAAAPLFIELPMAKVSESMKSGILAVNATTNYTTIRAVDLYQASGADDWWNGEAVKPGQDRVYGMTVELSPSGDGPWQGGFILPPTRIRGVGQEMTETVLRFTEFVLANPLPKKGGR